MFNAVGDSCKLLQGIVSALGWLEYEQAHSHIQRLLASDSPFHKFLAIAALAEHRHDPCGKLTEALSSNNIPLKARALRAAGELGRLDLFRQMLSSLNDKQESIRYAAARSSALLAKDEKAIQVLQAVAESEHPDAKEALELAARRMPHGAALQWQASLAASAETHRQAILAAGAIGDPALISWLITFMSKERFARVAGHAFSMITGVDIAYEDLDRPRPEGFESGPNDDPEDENVEMDLDEGLPWPDPHAVEGWWSKRRRLLSTGKRYLVGKTMSQENLEEILRTGRQPARGAAALELAILNPGQPLFNVRAPGFRQQRLLGLTRW